MAPPIDRHGLLFASFASTIMAVLFIASMLPSLPNGVSIVVAGLQMEKKCDCNPAGSNSTTECNRFTGQCDCKNANIIGLKCDKCRENYYDLASGCLECDRCYQIVQIGVDHHRKILEKLIDMVNKIENNPEVMDQEKFRIELIELTNRVKKLLQQAETAQNIEAELLEKFEQWMARIRRIKGITSIIDKHLKSASPLLDDAANNVTIAEDVLKKIMESANKAEQYIEIEGKNALNAARERADKLGQQSRKMSDMAKESRQLADQHEADAARIRELTLLAVNYTDQAYALAKDAAIAQDANMKNIAKIRSQIDKNADLLAKTKKMAIDAAKEARKSYDEALALYTLINSLQLNKAEIPAIKQRANEHLRNAQRLRSEVEEFITRHAQLLDSTQFKLDEMRALLAEAMRQQAITDAQLADIDKTIQKARDAVKQGDKTLKEAQDTLETLRKFDQKVQESQKEAMEALKKIPAIRAMIKQAEDKTKDAAAKLDTALADATDARDFARQAFTLANETSADVRRIRAEALELKGRITELKKQAGDLGDNINQTAAAMSEYERIAKTDGELALSILERANQAAMSARNATETAKGLLDILEPLLRNIDKIEGIDGNKLAQLEAELEKLKQKLIDSDLARLLEELLAARDKQRELMDYYKALIEWLINEVENIKLIRDSLPDKCFKRNRLEVPIHEN